MDAALSKQFQSTDTKEFTVLTHPSQTWLSERRGLKRNIFNSLFINAKSGCLGMTGPYLLSNFAHHNPTFRGASALRLGMGIQAKKGASEEKDRKPDRTCFFQRCAQNQPCPTIADPPVTPCIFPSPACLIILPFHPPPLRSQLPQSQAAHSHANLDSKPNLALFILSF